MLHLLPNTTDCIGLLARHVNTERRLSDRRRSPNQNMIGYNNHQIKDCHRIHEERLSVLVCGNVPHADQSVVWHKQIYVGREGVATVVSARRTIRHKRK